jgi:hypothetical protein
LEIRLERCGMPNCEGSGSPTPHYKLMKKRTFSIIVCLLTLLLVNACASKVQTVEVTRVVQQTVEVTRIVHQTLIIIQSATPNTTPYPPPAPYLAYPPNMTPTPLYKFKFTVTPFIKFTQTSPTLTSQQVGDKIAACYREGTGCSACVPKFNNSVQHIVATTRMFINAPKELYPKELFIYATTIDGNATMGYISNGGPPGLAMGGSLECWSTYVEFDGQGEVELRIPSILIGVLDYYVRFVVD